MRWIFALSLAAAVAGAAFADRAAAQVTPAYAVAHLNEEIDDAIKMAKDDCELAIRFLHQIAGYDVVVFNDRSSEMLRSRESLSLGQRLVISERALRTAAELGRNCNRGVVPGTLTAGWNSRYAVGVEAGLDWSSSKLMASGTTAPDFANESFSPRAGLFGLDVRMLAANPFTPLFPMLMREDVLVRGFAGFRLRRYFNMSGEQFAFTIHPGPGNETLLGYEKFYSFKFYAGLAFIMANPWMAADVFSHVVVSPYAGVNFENGRLRLRTDESGGGGVANSFSRTTTRGGPAVGVDLDFYMRNAPFFVGVGLQLDFLPAVSGTGVSGVNNFNYEFRRGSQRNLSASMRMGFAY